MTVASDSPKLLKLRAVDAEDVQVISAILQDSIAPVCDTLFQKEDGTFVMVVQRLRRETEAGECERICCAVTVKGVAAVKTHGIDLTDTDRILDLLALMLEPPNEKYPLPTLKLVFAGDAKIRLDLKGGQTLIEDFGEPWPALCKPCHDGE